ncbi:hypothetical protein HaLaN_28856 [Haematococcus lacustris]|uniref:Uncharacterized protein n=1 Tax=Haematococcus lacustris TaxID=44745 RepID=A0A6A0ADA2_HAELA|nr:hypothetical protein HaLaN_28856 [Haematococcus lacustris]
MLNWHAAATDMNLMVKQDLKELGMEQGLLEVTSPTPTPPAQQ